MKSSILFFCACFIFGPLVQAESLKPGLWKSKTSFNVNGIALPTSQSEECVTNEAAKNIQETISKELKKKNCKLTKWNLKGKKLEASLDCKSEELDAKGNIHGEVTEKSYELEGDAHGSYLGALPASATIKLSGQWTKSCVQ